MARLALALAATAATTSALVAPTAKKTVSATALNYDQRAGASSTQRRPAPRRSQDPANLAADASESELKRYREAELTHGRVAMLASVGFLVGESGATPLFGGNIDGIAINQFWKVPTGFWPVILLFIAVPETFRALRGWMEPTVPENYFDPEEFKIMQTKELQHGRLAMLAAAGMIVQELQTGNTLF
ncbi:chlorophyll A-B binding protein [Aureococcus anophagefferens]|nr:chlorophyll A-B binding protein [Aureococcus anophagefferens]